MKDVFERTTSLGLLVQQIEEASDDGEIEKWQLEIIQRLSACLEEDVESAGMIIKSNDARIEAIRAEEQRLFAVRKKIESQNAWLEKTIVDAINAHGDASREYGTIVRVKVVNNPKKYEAPPLGENGVVYPWCKTQVTITGLGPRGKQICDKVLKSVEKKATQSEEIGVQSSVSTSASTLRELASTGEAPQDCISVHQGQRVRIR